MANRTDLINVQIFTQQNLHLFCCLRHSAATLDQDSQNLLNKWNFWKCFLAFELELEPGFCSTSDEKFEQQICVVRHTITVNLKVPKNLSSKSCGISLTLPGLMLGPICVKLSGVVGVWWESDLGQKINFFVDLEIFLFPDIGKHCIQCGRTVDWPS